MISDGSCYHCQVLDRHFHVYSRHFGVHLSNIWNTTVHSEPVSNDFSRMLSEIHCILLVRDLYCTWDISIFRCLWGSSKLWQMIWYCFFFLGGVFFYKFIIRRSLTTSWILLFSNFMLILREILILGLFLGISTLEWNILRIDWPITVIHYHYYYYYYIVLFFLKLCADNSLNIFCCWCISGL